MSKVLAIMILFLLGILDALLVVSCSKLEEDRAYEDEEQAEWLRKWRERNGKAD